MARTSVVQEYQNPPPGQSSTFTLEERVQHEILKQGIVRPKGYTVSYHANPAVEHQHFGMTHPMKPWRLTLTNKIVLAYGMHEAMDLYLSRAATNQELVLFHTDEYIEFLQKLVIIPPRTLKASVDPLSRVTPFNQQEYTDSTIQFNIGDDCPIFDGLYPYCTLYAGASLDAARKLTSNQSDIAINWSGGLHHAKKSEASGFCYINDIVLAILQLLLYHPRVLYIDIDVHHGDGVEQAFWSTDRVMTLSFHKYDKDNFFPGTGGLDTTGPPNPANPGAHHSLNVPLHDGIEDDQYIRLFQDVVGPCVQIYQPSAIVLQCGADSLGGDRLGCFNLNIRAHGACLEYVQKFNLPLLVVGGGGYTPHNVSRLWAYETALCIGKKDIHPDLPAHTPFLEHFPDKTLFPPLSEFKRYDNRNTRPYLDSLVQGIREQLRYVEGSPSVQMTRIPPGMDSVREEVEREIREEAEGREGTRRERERGRRGELAMI
ncbi:histone deacetylase [Bachmanniomyces sp. S44760]|nr:histone deacetylase [Bachmanniomyces sp. S44760]